jgi:hypothetical protein
MNPSKRRKVVASDKEYHDAIVRVGQGNGSSNDHFLAERIANSHNHPMQREAKNALGR